MPKQKFSEIKTLLLAAKKSSSIAKIINNLDSYRSKSFLIFEPTKQADISTSLSKDSKEVILNSISDQQILTFSRFLDEDETKDLLSHLSKIRRNYILRRLKHHRSNLIQKIVQLDKKYLEKITDSNFILVKESFSLKEVSRKIEKHIHETKQVPLLLTSNESGIVTGFVPYGNLILTKKTCIKSLIKHLPIISQDGNNEKALDDALKTDTEVIGLISDDHEILGIIHLHDLLTIIRLKTTRAVYKFAGVNKEERPDDQIEEKVSRRYKWLILNLATAVLASMVVAIFEDAIAQISLLAVFMPMIAGEGGNGATQSLAVVVRGLASTKSISLKKSIRIIMKESVAGLFNGVIIGGISCVIALILKAPVILGLILGFSMIINMFVAGLFGAATPFILKKFKIDPAIASSIFVTTATDVFGFLTFLGLGAWLLT